MPAPCIRWCAGNAGSKANAWPWSVPTASTPKPLTSRSSTRRRTAAALGPGACGPSSLRLRKAAGSAALRPVGAHQHPGARRDPPVRAPRTPRCARAPCTKRSSAAASFEQSITQAGATKRCAGDRVGEAVGVVLAGDPVRRRVEMGPGVLAAGDVVPVPGRARARRSARSPRSGTGSTARTPAAAGSPASRAGASGCRSTTLTLPLAERRRERRQDLAAHALPPPFALPAQPRAEREALVAVAPRPARTSAT